MKNTPLIEQLLNETTPQEMAAIDRQMSENKQSSLDYYITKLTEILGPEIIKQISMDDNERIARLEKQAKAMHKEEIIDAFWNGDDTDCTSEQNIKDFAEQYYNETYGGNK